MDDVTTLMDVSTTEWNITDMNMTTAAAAPPFTFFYNPYMFTWRHAVEIGVLAFYGVLATPANMLLLYIQAQIKHKASTDYYVITLGIFDLYGATVNVAMAILHSGFKKYVISPLFCKIFVFSAYLVVFETAFLICGIAVDRFIMSILPLNKFYNAKVAKWACVVLASLSGLITLPYLLFLTMQPVFIYCAYTAGMDEIMNWWNRGMVFLIVVSFGFIVLSYTSIAIMLRRRHNQRVKGKGTVTANKNIPPENGKETTSVPSSTQNTEKQALEQSANNALKKKEKAVNRTTLILFAISLTYMMAWGIASSVILVNFTFPVAFSQLAHLFRRVTTVTNPLLFMSLSSKFRQLAKQAFCKR